MAPAASTIVVIYLHVAMAPAASTMGRSTGPGPGPLLLLLTTITYYVEFSTSVHHHHGHALLPCGDRGGVVGLRIASDRGNAWLEECQLCPAIGVRQARPLRTAAHEVLSCAPRHATAAVEHRRRVRAQSTCCVTRDKLTVALCAMPCECVCTRAHARCARVCACNALLSLLLSLVSLCPLSRTVR